MQTTIYRPSSWHTKKLPRCKPSSQRLSHGARFLLPGESHRRPPENNCLSSPQSVATITKDSLAETKPPEHYLANLRKDSNQIGFREAENQFDGSREAGLYIKQISRRLYSIRIVKYLILCHLVLHMMPVTNHIRPSSVLQYAMATEASSNQYSWPDSLLNGKLEIKDHDTNSKTIKPMRSPLEMIKQSHHHHHHRKSHKSRRHHREANRYYDSSVANADRPLVATRKGLVRGVTQKVFTGKFVDAFLGIPYAQPPVDKYRFRHPQDLNPWQGELDASQMSSSCFQVNDTFFGQSFLGTSIWNANTPLSEDCLYLNVWTPFGSANTTGYIPASSGRSSNQPNTQPKRPVLVWIFGGGFYSGTSSLVLYEGGVLASEEDMIVVSMNYRVSALGFLYFGRSDAPGNAGLFDQLMALQWISDNIHQFGGDPDRVTIFGESAGAVSVAFHLLSPLSRNLFHQAILQSGAATCPWGFKESREIIANGIQLANLLNCPTNQTDLDPIVECLLKADPMTLVRSSQEVGQTKTILNFPFVPVVDGSFLVESPNESLIKSNFKRAKILLGSNYDEGNSFLIYLPEFSRCPMNGQSQQQQVTSGQIDQANSQHVNSNMELRDLASQMRSESLVELSAEHPVGLQQNNANLNQLEAEAQHNLNQSDSEPCKPNEFLSLTREDFLRVLREDLNPYAEHPVGKEAIVFEYSNWNNPQDSVSNYDALDKIVGDYYFTCHVNELAHRYAQAGNQVYMYYFKQRSSISPWPKWMGVLHADEINFVFGEPLNQMFNYTTKEIELSKRMMKYWGNFARYGNPTKTSENTSMTEKWPEYADKRQYFELHGDFVRVGRGPRAKQCAFWAQYLPKLINSFDRSQCPAAAHSLHHSTIHPAEMINADFGSQRIGLLTNIPSSVLISFIVIIVLTIICLLVVYAKRKWKLDLGFSSASQANGSD